MSAAIEDAVAALELAPAAAVRLARYIELLLSENEHLNLTGARDAAAVLEHVRDSLTLAPFARAESSLASRLQLLAGAAPDARVARTFAGAEWPAAFAWLATRARDGPGIGSTHNRSTKPQPGTRYRRACPPPRTTPLG